ncbi:MAG: MATE family efflux transporter [Porphyrobacter sp.]|nr:MATE family efflux transporter [Porphyrobacter sp.]
MAKASGAITMTEGPLLSILIKVAIPITLTNLVQSSYDIVNALWLGQLGEVAIASVAASGPIFGVLISLGSGLSTAGAVLIAQNAGAKRFDALDHISAQTLLMVAIMALAFTGIGILASQPLLRLIGVEPEIAALADTYLAIRYAGMIPMFAFMAIQAMLQAVGEVRFAMRVQIGSLVFNALLDPILIFGFGPLPPFGVAGAAAATVIAQVAALAIVLHHMLTGRSALHLRGHHFRPDAGHIWLATGLGVPASIEQAIRTFSSLLLMSLAASFGTLGLASYGVGTRLLFFWFSPILGLSIAAATVVGQNVGAGLADRAEQAARTAAWLGFGALTLVGLAHLPFVPQIMAALAPGEEQVIANASTFAYIFLPLMGVGTVGQVMLGVFRGAGNTRQSMTLSIAQQWLFQMPAAWLLALWTPAGIAGVWWSYPIGGAALTAMTLAWFHRGPWRRQLVAAA